MSGGCGSAAGVSIAVTPAYALPSPPSPGPGCTATNTNNTACSAASAAVITPFGGGSGGGVSSSSNQQAQAVCAPNFDSTQINSNYTINSTTIDQGVILMTKNSLKSIAEATNQMIVNSITNTTSSSSQNVTIIQSMKINVNCKGDGALSGVSQEANAQGFQISTMTMTQIDQVRSDLATSVLGQFKANIDDQNKQTIDADLKSAMAAQNDSALTTDTKSKIEQTKTTQVPSADPAPLMSQNLNANTTLNQSNIQSAENAVNIAMPYTSSVEFDKTLQTAINNSVTQNFTKDTMNILVQTVYVSQDMDINFNGGGDCVLSDFNQKANILLRQMMSSKMDIGTAIVNSIQNQLGIGTDDSVANKNVQDATATTANDLRSGNASKSDMKSAQEYIQKITQYMDLTGSSGSSLSSCICCICCIISILSCGLGDMELPTSIGDIGLPASIGNTGLPASIGNTGKENDFSF